MNVKVSYIPSLRVRRVSILIGSSKEVVVKVPKGVSNDKAEAFVESKIEWIEKALDDFEKREKKFEGALKLPKGNKKDFLKYKEEAKTLVQRTIEVFNKVYRFQFGKITIRNTRSRWGSCSKKGNLNFNYKIVLLPSILADYIVVHELCHLGEFNHSFKFWGLVEQTIPDYKSLKIELRRVQSN